jgi:DNA-binding LacI/PurR family transcriptional regulator
MAKMTDIAREAGVSLSTVSYTLSGKRPISEDTRAKVQAAIERLDFHPAASGRALALQRTSTIGLAVPQREAVDVRVIMEFVSSILAEAHEHDHDVLLVTGEDHVRTRRVAEEGKVDGLIVMDVVEDDPRLASLATVGRPVVLIGYPSDPHGLSRVDFDFHAGAAMAVEELHSRGAERIAMIRPPASPETPTPTYERRARLGYLAACEAHDLTPTVLEVPATPAGVAALVRDHLLDGEQFDGLFVHHESALPLLGRACEALALRPPDAIQVVAIAPEDVAQNGPWDVSSVELPISGIGRRSIEVVLQQIGDPAGTPLSDLLPPIFHGRETTHPRCTDSSLRTRG